MIDEWTDLPPLGPSLDVVARHGPSVGVRLLAACTEVEAAGLERSVELFSTRLVLRVPEAAASVRLLGEPRAEDLDGVGEAWPLVSGRILPRIRGFHIPPEHAAALVAEMRRRLSTAEVPERADRAEPGPGEVAAVETAGVADEPPEAEAVDAVLEDGRQLPLIRAVLVSPSQGGPRLHVQVLGAHVTRVDQGEEIRPEGKPLAWQLFELAASHPPGDATMPLVGQLVWPSWI